MIPSSSPQESQGLQWKVEGAKVSVSGAEDAMKRISKQLERLDITPSSSASKTITISKEDFSKLQASDSSLSIPDDTRSQLVAAVQTAQAKQPTRDMFVSFLNEPSHLQQFIDDGRVNEEDEFGSTLLHVAAVRNEPEAIALLLEAGAGIDAQDDAGETPLYSAAEWGNNEAVQALIKAGANPHLAYYVAVKEKDQIAMDALKTKTDIHKVLALAAAEGNMEVIDALIENKGIDIAVVGQLVKESADDTTKANLLYALNRAVYLLVKAKVATNNATSWLEDRINPEKAAQANEDFKSRHGGNLLHLFDMTADVSGALQEAAKEKDAGAIEWLQRFRVALSTSDFKSYYESEKKEDAQFLLKHSEGRILAKAVFDDFEFAKDLVSQGNVDLDAVVCEAIFDHILALSDTKTLFEIIDKIKELGSVDINRVICLVYNRYGSISLDAHEKLDLAMQELIKGADVEKVLLAAIKENSRNISVICRKLGVNEGIVGCIALQDEQGKQWLSKQPQMYINNALLAAVRWFDAKTVEDLCKLGASPNIVWDGTGETLLYLAAKRGDSEMIKTLIAHGATVQESLERIASHGTVSALDAFVRAGVRPDAKSYPDGFDLLTTASTYNPGMVDPLLSTGWVNLEALLVNSVAAEYGGLRPAVPSSVVLAKRPDMETAIKIVEKKDLPRDKIDQIVSKIRQLYA